MKKIAILMVLMMGLLALAGCSSDNESVMLEYDLLANVETPDGTAANGATVTINSSDNSVNETKTADENGVVQFKKLVSDTYTMTASYDIYRAMENVAIRGSETTVSLKLTDKLYLYSSEFGSSYKVIDWADGATTLTEISDGNYNNVYEVSSGSVGWSSLAFSELSNSYLSDYESITFKVKSDDLERVLLSVGASNNTLTIENGTDLGNGWYELTVPFSGFTDPDPTSTQVAFMADNSCTSDDEFAEGETFNITDVYFTAGSSEDETVKTPKSISGPKSLEMIEGEVIDIRGEDITVTYTDDSTKTISSSELTFTSSDTNVATVDGSVLTAVAEGTATITASYTENGTAVKANIELTVNPAAPETLAAAPTLAGVDVISLFNSSGTYTDKTIDNWNPDWGQGGSLTGTTVDGKTLKLLDLDNYQGIDFDTNRIDITGKTTLHISYWTPDTTKISIYPIDASGEAQIVTDILTQGEWAELEIDFSSMDDPTTLRQLKLTGQTSIGGANEDGACTIYMDNIYFH